MCIWYRPKKFTAVCFQLLSIQHWYCTPFWYDQLLGYSGDRAYADTKPMFEFTSFLIPRIAKKLCGGLGTRLCIHGRLGTRLYHLTNCGVLLVSKKNPERCYAGLMKSVSCFIRPVIYFMRLVSYSIKSVSKYLLTPIRGCGRLGTRVARPSVGSIKTLWSSFGLPSLQPTLII